MTGYFAEYAGESADADGDDLDDFDVDVPEMVIKSHEGASPRMQAYFAALEQRMRVEYQIAEQCRALGLDPETVVEIPPATDLAARCEELMKDFLPERGVAERIRELAKVKNREETSLIVAKEVAAGRFGKFDSLDKMVDAAVRVGLAILTEGILVAPLEGIAGVRVLANDDGTNCVAVSFAGPIRAAGGTGQALSVLIADVVRRELKIGRYKATDAEVQRLKEEIPAYKMAANLQYTPTADEIDLIVRNCPVMIDGEGTEKEEVGGNRDLPRLETNQIRGGACLVIAEGLTQKAPKVQKHVKALKLEGWEFIDIFVNKGKSKGQGPGQEGTGAGPGTGADGRPVIGPDTKFMADIIAGRPVFSHPSRKGGWRLRYGRARTGGLATLAVHPAAMSLVDDFLAVGTQMKIERPGKATVATPCDTIEPPMALLHNGSLVELSTIAEVHAKRSAIRRIVDLGEILVPYGEFVENNKPLPQSPWCVEWWAHEMRKAGAAAKRGADEPAGSFNEAPVEPEDAESAFALAERTATPLHPRFTLFWHDATLADVRRLAAFVREHGRWTPDARLALPKAATDTATADGQAAKEILMDLCALHDAVGEEYVLARHALPLVRGLGLVPDGARLTDAGRAAPPDVADPVALATAHSGVEIRARAPFRIGTRMGRPEKAAERKMAPPVHALFPIGQAGGAQRLVKDAAKAGTVEVEIGMRQCPLCREKTILLRCPACGPARGGAAHTTIVRPHGARVEPANVRMDELLASAQSKLGSERLPDTIKGVLGLISRTKTPEPLEKGILRAEHEVFTFKDGTARFDMTDITLTHFKPREVNQSVERLRELGYERDAHGEPLERDDQVLELLVQDIVVSTSCLDYMLKCARFVDDELKRLYGFKPYYNAKTREDLVGHLFVALAPHTSGGVLCRVIGHNAAQGHFGHPYFHAAKRRNCVDADAEILLLEGGRVRRERMGPWIDALLEKRGWGRRMLDAYGTEKLALPPGTRVVSLDPVTRVPVELAVTSVIRGWTEQWVRFETASGRAFLATPDHNVLTSDDGRWVVKPMEKVEAGDLVPVASTLDVPESDPVVALAAALAAVAPDLRVRGATAVLKDVAKTLGKSKLMQIAGLEPADVASVARWAVGPALGAVAKLVAAGALAWSDLPAGARLANGREEARCAAALDLRGAAAARVVGAFLAAGRSRLADRRRHEVRFACPPDADAALAADLESVFGAAPERVNGDLVLAGRVPHLVLANVLRLGEMPAERRLPDALLAAPRAAVEHVLAGARLAAPAPEAGVRLPGEKLASDVASLFLRVGLATRLDGSVVVPSPSRSPSPYALDRVERVEVLAAPGNTYCIDVDSGSSDLATKNVLWANQLYQIRCDGDEDCVMLLLDGLLNFSRAYLPSNRGGLMDAPLTLTMRIDPSEVDKEAHNVDTVWGYPLEFYEATMRHPAPGEVEKLVATVKSRLGTAGQYEGIGFTHDTADISEAPAASAYKTIGSMMDKMDAQLSLASKLRAVDAADVAARVIGSHFLPDLMGNLKAFSKQAVRCTKCGAKFRRIPLVGKCIKNNCGGNLTMTVYEASVKKYLEVSKEVCEKYGVNPYVRQRLEHIEDSIDSLFQNDKVKKAKLTDFL